jgi:hypothetical protein
MRALLALLVCAQQDVPPRMPVDEGATSFACTFEAALRQNRCTLEGEPGPAADNSRLAGEASASVCAALIEEGPLRKECLSLTAEATREPVCTLSGKARLVDDNGLATPAAARCIARLREQIHRVEARAALAGDCCGCLAAAGCSVAEPRCRGEMGLQTPSAAVKACLVRSCSDRCMAHPEPLVPEETPARKPNKI